MSLQFNVSQMMKGAVGETRSYDFAADEPLDLDGSTARDVQGHVKFTLTNFGVVANIHADAVLELNCARCLENFETPTQVDFEEEFEPSIDIVTGLPAKQPHTEGAFRISATHTIDLTEALRQNFLLAQDLIPVCTPDCRGLCPTCGVNRNLQACDCVSEGESNPFSALQVLLGETEATKETS